MVIDNILHERGSNVSKTYLIPEYIKYIEYIEETNLQQSTQEDTNVNHDNKLN